jgi:hypothetical protein
LTTSIDELSKLEKKNTDDTLKEISLISGKIEKKAK